MPDLRKQQHATDGRWLIGLAHRTSAVSTGPLYDAGATNSQTASRPRRRSWAVHTAPNSRSWDRSCSLDRACSRRPRPCRSCASLRHARRRDLLSSRTSYVRHMVRQYARYCTRTSTSPLTLCDSADLALIVWCFHSRSDSSSKFRIIGLSRNPGDTQPVWEDPRCSDPQRRRGSGK